jgi:hypothetical protein
MNIQIRRLEVEYAQKFFRSNVANNYQTELPIIVEDLEPLTGVHLGILSSKEIPPDLK